MIDIALISRLSAAGVHFVYTTPGNSRSNVMDWPELATREEEQLRLWVKQGFSLVAVARQDGAFLIDVDDLEACVALGLNPAWLRGYFHVNTPSGGHHYYGLHDAESAALGGIVQILRTKGDRDSGLVFELKLHHQTVAAPTAERRGQKKKDGAYIPDGAFNGMRKGLDPELAAWLKENAEQFGAREYQNDEVCFHEDWDQDTFLADYHCTEKESGTVGNALHVVVQECPLCDRGATNSTLRAGKTKFIFGGVRSFGFICHYCGVNSRKELEIQLKERYPDFEPWTEVIYADEDRWSGNDDMNETEETQLGVKQTSAPPEKCYRQNCNCGGEHAQTSMSPERRAKLDATMAELEQQEEATPEGEVQEPSETAPAEQTPKILSAEELLIALTNPGKIDYKDPIGSYLNKLGDIPDTAMYGRMREWAEQMELPLSVAYPAILGAYSALPKYDEILGVRFNLYVALLMPVGGGKNLALERACKVLNLRPGLDYEDATLGGAGGLWNALGDKKEGRGRDATAVPGPRKMLLNPAEFGATLTNTKIDNSTLAGHLCNLWDKNRISMPTREGKREVNCRLSILGALPVDKNTPEQFSRFFSEETAHGLHSRFIFGHSSEKYDNRWAEKWQPSARADESEMEGLIPDVQPGTTPPTAWDTDATSNYTLYVLPDDEDGRGLYNLKRIALLTATANGDKTVTVEAVQAAWFFMTWQAQIKRAFRIGIAQKASGGELSDTILQKLRQIDQQGAYERSPVIDGRLNINLARVIHKNNWVSRYGSEAVQRTISSLLKLGMLGRGKAPQSTSEGCTLQGSRGGREIPEIRPEIERPISRPFLRPN